MPQHWRATASGALTVAVCCDRGGGGGGCAECESDARVCAEADADIDASSETDVPSLSATELRVVFAVNFLKWSHMLPWGVSVFPIIRWHVFNDECNRHSCRCCPFPRLHVPGHIP